MSDRFRKATAGTLIFYPPENAASSAATVALYYPGGGVLQAAATATRDATSTTIGAAVTRSAQVVTVASATGIVAGTKYVIAEAGRSQVVTVKSVSGTTVYLMDRVAFALTTSATFKGWKLTYALTATHTADLNTNYRAHWAYTIGGVSYQAESYFDVVGVDQSYGTSWSDVLARHGWIQQWVRSSDLDGGTYLDTAWDVVREKFRARKLRLERVRDYTQLVGMHCACVNWLLADERAMNDPSALPLLEQAERRLISAQDDLFSDLSFYDADEDLNASGDEQGITVTHWGLTR